MMCDRHLCPASTFSVTHCNLISALYTQPKLLLKKKGHQYAKSKCPFSVFSFYNFCATFDRVDYPLTS